MTNPLTCSEADLPRVAGEVLVGKGHIWSGSYPHITCSLCNKYKHDKSPVCTGKDIPLTPANAFKWRDWAIEKYGWRAFDDALAEVGCHQGKADMKWHEFALKLTPADYIRAACECKLNSEKGKNDE